MSNKETYEREDVVHYYTDVMVKLEKPEEAILRLLKNRLKDMKMLDLGVGGGRTTPYFAELVKEYVGVDYSRSMIKACKERFKLNEHLSFKVADARNLKEFKDNSFDFVLFSFNGLDYMDEHDRIKALKEIKRVLKDDGVFAFSSHNLNSLETIYSVCWSKNIFKSFKRIVKYCTIVIMNGTPEKLKKKDWAIIHDSSHKFGLQTYYAKPAFQIQQLREFSFKNLKMFSLEEGKEISTSNLEEVNDSWIYYLCDLS